MAEHKPREPKDLEYTGAGTARSADDGLQEPGAFAEDEDVDAAVVTGATTSSHPAESDEVAMNRSGSGGSGGPMEHDAELEGSTGSSMSELLTGEDDARPQG